MNNVLEYLEASAAAFPGKTAVKDDKTSCTYNELLTDAKKAGILLAKQTDIKKPIAVFMDKGVITLKAFMGILYSGNFYTPTDIRHALITFGHAVKADSHLVAVIHGQCMLLDHRHCRIHLRQRGNGLRNRVSRSYRLTLQGCDLGLRVDKRQSLHGQVTEAVKHTQHTHYRRRSHRHPRHTDKRDDVDGVMALLGEEIAHGNSQ